MYIFFFQFIDLETSKLNITSVESQIFFFFFLQSKVNRQFSIERLSLDVRPGENAKIRANEVTNAEKKNISRDYRVERNVKSIAKPAQP